MSIASKIPKLNLEYEIIGETTIPEARANHWPRLVVRVFIIDDSGKILLQQRSATSYIFPNLWDLAAAGHVDSGDTLKQAAERELLEEVGLRATLQLIEERVPVVTETDHVVSTLYKGTVPAGSNVTIDTDEVAQTQWCTADEVDQMLADDESQFMLEFTSAWQKHRDILIK